jgi:anti-anti-sigma factor
MESIKNNENAENIEIKVDEKNRKVFVKIEGELSIYTVASVREKVLNAFEAYGDIEVDLGNVIKMDTAGFQLILSCRLYHIFLSRQISFINASREVARVFDLYREKLA